jgi:predicted dehydrogenase
MIGIGIIGGGRIAGGHAQAVAANPELLTLRGIASARPERGAELTGKFGGTAYTDWRHLLERPEIEAVVIGLRNDQHLEAVLAAARAGKHILLEKPMAMTLAECDRMIEATRAAGVKLLVGQTQHFFAVNQAAKRLLDSGEIGHPIIVTDTWYKPFGLAVRQPWFLDRAHGGGMWFMNGNHMIDRVIWFTGSPVVAVRAKIGNSLLGLKADDSSVAVLEHKNGLLTTLTHAGYAVGDERWIGEFVCTKGMLKVSTFPPGPGVWAARQSAYEPVPYTDHDALAAEFRAFGECIRDRTPEPVAPEHARHVLQVMLAAEESSRLGREVRLP